MLTGWALHGEIPAMVTRSPSRARALALLLATAALAASSSAAPAAVRAQAPRMPFYRGADLSYVNEMQDCGAVYRVHGRPEDPFHIFATHGTNLVRVRLWMDPDWTRYSTLRDVERTIARARREHMQVLLDFHYSDTWADGDKQVAPRVWAGVTDPARLAGMLYQYTYDVLRQLDAKGLMPEMVQVGNETNTALVGSRKGDPIDWQRNALLFNAGITAARDAGARSSIHPRVMLHIAQPENAEPWFAAATAAGVRGYDQIGLSYYAKWSTRTIAQLGETIRRLRATYGKDVMVVETAYPWTLENADSMPNLLGGDAIVAGYPATPEGQARYLVDLTQAVVDAGGNGVVYWEPAWVSTTCRTPWGRGSGWDNATFFDFHRGNELLPAVEFMQRHYGSPAR